MKKIKKLSAIVLALPVFLNSLNCNTNYRTQEFANHIHSGQLKYCSYIITDTSRNDGPYIFVREYSNGDKKFYKDKDNDGNMDTFKMDCPINKIEEFTIPDKHFPMDELRRNNF